MEFLTSVCQLVAGVFDSTALLGEAREVAHLREELVELGAELAVAGEAQDIAERAATRLRRATGCVDCDIWWLEEGYLRCLASVDDNGVDEEVRGNILHLDYYPRHRAGDTGPGDPHHRLARRRARHRVRARRLPRVGLPQRRRRSRWSATTRSSASSTSSTRGRGTSTTCAGSCRRPDARSRTRCATPSCSSRLRRGNAVLRELVELGDRLNEAGTLEDLAREVAERAALPPRRRGLRHLAGGRRRAALPRQRGQPRLGRRRGRLGARARDLRGDGGGPLGQRADGRRRPRQRHALRRRDAGLPPLGLPQHGLSAAGRGGPRHRPDRRVRHQGPRLHPAPRHDPQRRAAPCGILREGDAGRAAGAGQPRPDLLVDSGTGVRRHARRGRGAAHGGGTPAGGLPGRPVRHVPARRRRGGTARLARVAGIAGDRGPAVPHERVRDPDAGRGDAPPGRGARTS